VSKTSLGSRYWRWRLREWGPPHEREAGYTLLVPVPGDLPVFLDLALTACLHQNHAHRRATVVLPDRPSADIDRIVTSYQGRWPGELTVKKLPHPERWLLPVLRSGSRNHGLQVITGVRASESSHIMLHDADLFPRDVSLHDFQYEACRQENLDCLGLTGVWDPWYEEKGLELAATWELCARVEWFRAFAPHLHIGHVDRLFGESHVFDTTLFPQAKSDPTRISRGEDDGSFVHFNYVITTYRLFQKQGPGYLDDRFRLLFIAILVELFASSDQDSALPSLETMAATLGSRDATVRHLSFEKGKQPYAEFREKLQTLFTITWVPPGHLGRVHDLISRFDKLYEFMPSPRDG
jgi:hypothetical protein